MQVLIREAKRHNLSNELKRSVAGFIDTLPAFRQNFPGLSRYSQTSIYNEFLSEEYDAHNALADVKALQRLLRHQKSAIPFATLQSCSYTIASATEFVDFSDLKNRHLQSLKRIPTSSLSDSMKGKIAEYGLCYRDLKLTFQRGGAEGLKQMLMGPNHEGKVRVTKNRKVLDKICEYFVKL